MPPIGSSEIVCAERPGVGHREEALQSLDFGNALFGIHTSQYLTEKAGRSIGATTPSVEFAHNQNRIESQWSPICFLEVLGVRLCSRPTSEPVFLGSPIETA
jgi:hypothetical protein